MIFLANRFSLILITLVSYTVSKSDSNVTDGERKQVVVVPSHKSSHSSDVIVIGGAGSGEDGEQIDKDTISTLSNNILSTTNLVHAQSQVTENLGKQLQNLQHSLSEEKRRQAKDTQATQKLLSDVGVKLQNTTNLVNVLVLMWSKSEKNYLKIVKKLEREVVEEKALASKNNKFWEQRFRSLEKKLETIHIGADNARRLAASKRSRWPRGKYCILANGSCPAGFYRQRGFLKTIYMYGNGANYIKSMRMGSSYIGCYGQHCDRYGGHYATINIATCCK